MMATKTASRAAVIFRTHHDILCGHGMGKILADQPPD
jgi:hypothetical protein